MKKLFIRKPSGGGWLVDEDGKERACCNYEIEDCLREQILSLFDEEGVNEVMITVEIIREMKIEELQKQGTAKRRLGGLGKILGKGRNEQKK